jgi:hypothetical protein
LPACLEGKKKKEVGSRDPTVSLAFLKGHLNLNVDNNRIAAFIIFDDIIDKKWQAK